MSILWLPMFAAMQSNQMQKRSVITGLGVISAIGGNLKECWNSILENRSGIAPTETVDTRDCYSNFAAEVKTQLPDSQLDRATVLCLQAAKEAMEDAGLDDFAGDLKTGVIMGSCVGGGQSIEAYYHGKTDANTIRNMPISAVANHVAALCHAGGLVTNVANACAAGTISIAYAADLIRNGKAEVILAGGADAFSSVPYAGFLSLHALAEQPCSPFNRSDGITLGEGAGVLVVESYEHAMERGARIYCEVLGSGISSDAYHITAPRPDGEGQMNAIRSALTHAGKTPGQIDYVNAHGTGTAKNDEAEFLSLHTLFDQDHPKLYVSSTKAMTGHCLGAAGAIEAVFSIKALCENIVPATLGYTEDNLAQLAEKTGEMDFCPNKAKTAELSAVMSNSFAFGGNNASIVFGTSDCGREDSPRKEAVITGLGFVTPLGNGKHAFLRSLEAHSAISPAGGRSVVGAEDFASLGLKMAFYRKLDRLSQLQAVSGLDALRDSGYEVTPENAFRIGMIIGTSEGALGPSCEFQKLITEKGNANGSAFKFPNTVYNAAGGYLSICAGIKGYNVTVTNGPQSGLQSLSYGADVIGDGLEEAMLVTGSDENNDIITELCTHLGYGAAENDGKGITLSDGSVSILLEERKSALTRSARVYCRVAGYASANCSVPFGTVRGSEDALYKAISQALAQAGLTAGDLDGVVGFANGHPAVDEIQQQILRDLSVSAGKDLPVFSLKEQLGEGRAASAAMAAAYGALLLYGDMKTEFALERLLILSFGTGGSYTAVILER